jgi:hypothetical protein
VGWSGDADPFGPHRPVGLPSLLPLGLFGPVPVAVDQGPVRADEEKDAGDGHDQDEVPEHVARPPVEQLGHREHDPRGGRGHQSAPDAGSGAHHVEGDDHGNPTGARQGARTGQEVEDTGQDQGHHQDSDGVAPAQGQGGQGGQGDHGGHGEVERRSVVEEAVRHDVGNGGEHDQQAEHLDRRGEPCRGGAELGGGHPTPGGTLRRRGA